MIRLVSSPGIRGMYWVGRSSGSTGAMTAVAGSAGGAATVEVWAAASASA
jgi:hypothetical protein